MGRAPCCDKANVKRGPWSPEEDATLKSYVESHGTGGNWIALPRKAGLRRCGKSCRLRWLNYLRPDIKHGGFTEEEDNIICSLYLQMGSRWSVIASQLPGRTDNDVKNYWNTKLRKKMFAGQISALTMSKSSSQSPINHATININPASSPSMASPCFPKTETHDSSAFPNSQAQSSAVSHLTTDNINNPGLTLYSQRVSFDPYLCNPRFMDFSEYGTSPISSKNSPINVNYSSSQEGSSISDSSWVPAALGDKKHCDEDAEILMDFGFGLPYYDIVNGIISFEEKASEIACTSLADCTSVNSIIPQGLNQSVINYY